MKKLYICIITLLFFFCIFLSIEKHSLCKIIKIISPTEILVDINRNYLPDEDSPIIIDKIYFISKKRNNNEDEIFKSITDKERIFLYYQAKQTSKDILKNKFVKIKNNEIFIENKKYKDLLVKSEFFFDETRKTKEKILNTLKKYNIDDYVILNTKSRRYHKITCDEIENIKNYRIVNKKDLTTNTIPCQKCNKPVIKETDDETQQKIIIDRVFEKNNIKVIYTDLNEIFKPSTDCSNIACKTLKTEIDNAKNSIDFAIYGISNQPLIINSLINAQNRGVKIRWVCDHDKKDTEYYKHNQILKQKITTYNTDEKYDIENRPAIMHNKFFIFDDKKVFTGSSNITSTDLSGFNENISILITSEPIAKIYKEEFEQLYNGYFHTDKKQINKNKITINNKTEIEVLFSPKDKIITKKIIPLIRNAEKYIYLPVFLITKKELLNELAYAQNKGVDIRIINDATSSNIKYSIHKNLREYGIRVKTENYAGKLHSKAMIIDDKFSLIGSMNFSNNGEKRNDENVIIIKDEEITKYLKNVFMYLWNKIPSEYETKDAKAESTESIGSCSDNIDNDFDGRIDKNDSGCKTKQFI